MTGQGYHLERVTETGLEHRCFPSTWIDREELMLGRDAECISKLVRSGWFRVFHATQLI